MALDEQVINFAKIGIINNLSNPTFGSTPLYPQFVPGTVQGGPFR